MATEGQSGTGDERGAEVLINPVTATDAAPAAAGTHEHQWTRCPSCPHPGQPCACSGVACCEQERREAPAAHSRDGSGIPVSREGRTSPEAQRAVQSAGTAGDIVAAIDRIAREVSIPLTAAAELLAAIDAHVEQRVAAGRERCIEAVLREAGIYEGDAAAILYDIADVLRQDQP